MTLLKRYVLAQFIKIYLLTASGLIGIFLIVDFFERIDEFLAKDAPMIDLVSYYIFKIPFIAFYMAPQGVLLATVITLASLAKNNEFAAMKACGISITGITLPIIGASLVVALAILASSEFLSPITNQKMNYIFMGKIQARTSYGKIPTENLWFRSANGDIWSIDYFDPYKSKLEKVIILKPGKNNSISQRIDAREAIWSINKWEFLDGYIRKFGKGGIQSTEYFAKKTFPTPETPKNLSKAHKRPEEMSLSGLYKIIKTQASEGKDTSMKWIELHRNISYPFISVVMALLAIPLSIRSSRHGGLLFCVGINLAMGFVFSFIYAMSISLGRGGTFDPILAAWGPNLLFTVLGFYLLLTMDSEKAFPI